MHSIQGSHASYNVQSVVDDKHGLIVHAEAVSETSDVNQFAQQIDKAKEILKEVLRGGIRRCGLCGHGRAKEGR